MRNLTTDENLINEYYLQRLEPKHPDYDSHMAHLVVKLTNVIPTSPHIIKDLKLQPSLYLDNTYLIMKLAILGQRTNSHKIISSLFSAFS